MLRDWQGSVAPAEILCSAVHLRATIRWHTPRRQRRSLRAPRRCHQRA